MIHVARHPSSSEHREVGKGAERSSGGDLGFSYLCEASHNTYIYIRICIYIYMYIYSIYIVYIYIYSVYIYIVYI